MSFKIKEIYIENFKSIEESHLDLKDKDLTVLDGPNGFGKTSIFDAIELVLTGAIRRIINMKITVGNKGYDDYLFARDQTLPIIIKIKLQKEDSRESVIIGRQINHTNLSRISKRPEFFPSTIHLLNKIDENLTSENQITSLDGILDTESFQNTYGLYNYIEQEESTHFLKQTENDRMAVISKLFNIEKEESEREKLVKARNKMSANMRTMEGKLKDTEKSLDLNVVDKGEDKVEYFQLLPDSASKKEIWDKVDVKPLDLRQKEIYFKRIDAFEYLINNNKSFQAMYFNEGVNALINNNERIEAVLLLYHFHDKMEELKKDHDRKVNLNKYLILFEKRDILNPNINWEALYDYFELPITMENVKDKLTIIRNLKQNSNQLSNMITNLLNTKEQLVKSFEALVSAKEVSNDTCPLCGKEWLDYFELMNQITNQTNLYKEKQDEASNEAVKLIDELYTNIINKLIEDIKDLIGDLIDGEVYEILRVRFEKGINIKKAKGFFDKLSIDIGEIAYNKLENFDSLPTKVEQVQEKLRGSLMKTDSFDSEMYDELKDIYNNTFEKNEELLSKIDVEKFKLKKGYLNYLYFLQSSTQYQNYRILNEKYDGIKNAFDAIDRALQVYNNKIINYRTKMIKEIEIPFFIYSGKIIQNHQRGIGIFIREEIERNKESKIKAISFVPPQKTDHDIVHTFSSGQLSATVLAFTLALNKVYNNSGLNTLLIDDPIQTMDEMNMASFVELLRNDFERQQIILSTHDNQISLYIRYKFSKYGYRTTQINVKEQFYN